METLDPFISIPVIADLFIRLYPLQLSLIPEALVLILLFFISSMASASEVAYFSLSPADIADIREKNTSTHRAMIHLHEMPERLLATILIINNLVNVGIVILSSFMTTRYIDFSMAPAWLSFTFQVVIITFLILLFGEIMPKIYANAHAKKFALFIAMPLTVVVKFFHPLSTLLIHSTSLVNRRFTRSKRNISMDDISNALELPTTQIQEDERILKGIATFGNTEVSEIMVPRLDVLAVEINTRLKKLLSTVIRTGYSRIPIFEETFDNVKGILYTKDLLPHLHEKDDFRWQPLIHPPYFVPETKKINDLMKEFQTKKIHMAVVIDEYGGSQGIVTLEDILEEIVGEISDEFDEDEVTFSRIDDHTFLFEGKTLLNDFFRILSINPSEFDNVRGEADTLAGMILEMQGEIPMKNELVYYGNYTFRIESVDQRRIKKIRVTIK